MKELVLDIKTWRCGMYGPNQLGEGETELLNQEGYMCCIGQFACQLGCSKNKLLKEGDFNEGDFPKIKGLNKIFEDVIFNTVLTNKAIKINDDEDTTPLEKIKKLKSLFSKNGFKIKIKNEKLLKNINT